MRAQMPEAAAGILNARTLAASHRRLAEILQPGMTVLDVGCGTGTITRGIADVTGHRGLAVGVDLDVTLLAHARVQTHACTNLHFVRADIHALPFAERFDIVTAARVLQWLANPTQAVKSLSDAVKN